jgi:Tetratricopeptide repeat
MLASLGLYLWASTQLIAARATLQRALAIFEATHGPDHPNVTTTLANLRLVQQRMEELC